LPEKIIEQAGNLGWIAGAFTVVYQTYRKLSARETRKEDAGMRKAIDDLRKQNAELSHQIADLAAQMRPNGGGSIKDDLTAIRRDSAVLAQIPILAAEVRHIRRQMVMDQAMSRMTLDMDDRIVWQTHPDGRVKFMSAAIERWTGRTPEEMMDEDWRNAIHESDADRVYRVWGQVIEQRRSLEISFRFLGEHGKSVPVFVRGYPQFDEGRDGREFAGWVGYMIREEAQV